MVSEIMLEDDHIDPAEDATLLLPHSTSLNLDKESSEEIEDSSFQIKYENNCTLDDLFEKKEAKINKIPEEIKEVFEDSNQSSGDKNRYFKKRTRQRFEEDIEDGLDVLFSLPRSEKNIKRNIAETAEKSSENQEWILS
jgi:hypothetical protein